MNEQEVTCSNPNCVAVMGTLVKVENNEWLQMGGGICREWHGVCACCGKEFHWSISDQMLESLIKRCKKQL